MTNARRFLGNADPKSSEHVSSARTDELKELDPSKLVSLFASAEIRPVALRPNY